MKPHSIVRFATVFLRFALTLVLIIAGAQAARLLWKHYRVSPWTRDGRVIAETVRIVPEVSGKVSKLLVSDNQLVRKGDVLFTVDRENYMLAMKSADALLATRKHEFVLKQEAAERRRKLAAGNAISAEELEMAENALEVARFAVDAADAALNVARLDLDRTEIVSPVNGYVTNLHLREGAYATAGEAQLSIIDADSFWVAGYFEETKLASVHPGDRARIDLMGGGSLHGFVESLSRGIADSTTATKGPAEVDPVFSWVRLAQRIPVRIKLDPVPAGVFLSSGMTCNVHVETIAQSSGRSSPANGVVTAKTR